MDARQLTEEMRKKSSFLCIGLDTDIKRIPKHLLSLEDPVFEFNRQIIDATQDLCVAYKPNLAFYEALGPAGLESLKKTLDYIPDNIFVIADAKRGDIGNTASLYARSFFEQYNFNAVTVSPYMGRDSVVPFLEYKGKWTIVLGLTSNQGAADLQLKQLDTSEEVYLHTMRQCAEWGDADQLMFVVGATKTDYMTRIREQFPEYWFLVPGVGAQGGNLKEVCAGALNPQIGLLVNSSRGIIYAGAGEDFAQEARKAALTLQAEMEEILNASF